MRPPVAGACARPIDALWLFLALLVLLPGCATRSVHQRVVDHYDLKVQLRAERKIFRHDVPRGFQQPVVISAARLTHILDAVEVDMLQSEKSAIRERRTAIARKMVPKIAIGLSEALELAGPDQEVVVIAIRKQMQHGLFNRKFLTSFVAYVQDDRLYLHFSRIDWRMDEEKTGRGVGNRGRLPEPHVDDNVMRFQAVTNEYFHEAGRQGVAVQWSNPVFATDVVLPGSSGDEQMGENASSDAPSSPPPAD